MNAVVFLLDRILSENRDLELVTDNVEADAPLCAGDAEAGPENGSKKEKSMTEATSNVIIAKHKDGKWSFALTFRGVTHPASGKFASQLQAQAAGMAALKALETGTRR